MSEKTPTKIIQKDESDVLRSKAKAVPQDMIGSQELSDIIESMKRTLATQRDGVAIAAPQIGKSLRIFVVSGKVYDQLERADSNELEAIDEKQTQETSDKVFINPEISKTSKKIVDLDEGCLSVRHYFGKVPRHAKVTIKALDQDGVPFTEGRSGLLAQIFQHETDHLNGVLFIDKANNVEYRDPDTARKEH
ncbi:MAG: peptide deformylase [Candidatus Paceibacterota bacterium]